MICCDQEWEYQGLVLGILTALLSHAGQNLAPSYLDFSSINSDNPGGSKG